MTLTLRKALHLERKTKAIQLYQEKQGNIYMNELGTLIGVTEHEASRYISQWLKAKQK